MFDIELEIAVVADIFFLSCRFGISFLADAYPGFNMFFANGLSISEKTSRCSGARG